MKQNHWLSILGLLFSALFFIQCKSKIEEKVMASTWGLVNATLIETEIDPSANVGGTKEALKKLVDRGMLICLKKDGSFTDQIGSDQFSNGTWDFDKQTKILNLHYGKGNSLKFLVLGCEKRGLSMKGEVEGLPIRFLFARQEKD